MDGWMDGAIGNSSGLMQSHLDGAACLSACILLGVSLVYDTDPFEKKCQTQDPNTPANDVTQGQINLVANILGA